MGERIGWLAVITFESAKGEPTCVRTAIDDPEPDVAARKAVFRAVRDGKPRNYESVVIVLTERLETAADMATREAREPRAAGEAEPR